MKCYMTKCPECGTIMYHFGSSIYPLQIPLKKCSWCGYQTQDRDRKIDPDPRVHYYYTINIMEALTTIGEFYGE